MPDVVLKDYLDEISRLIEESRLDEAIVHCRHLLKQFPRHVETYRLLGKALLEKEQFSGAKDVFRRVLSADPEDFIAHAGLAIMHKQENRLPEAAWHMERAFEGEPYNVAIREALQDIIGRRDGLPPEQLALTPAALARLNVRGELYAHAINDLRQALAKEPDRIDLQLLLAEALWRDGQRIDAADECVRILETAPDCVKANAMLAEVCLVTDRVEEAQTYLRRVFELTLPTADVVYEDDPVGIAFATQGSPPLPRKIMVDRATFTPAPAPAVEAGDWINDLDFGDEISLDEGEPKWLGGLQDVGELAGKEDDTEYAEIDALAPDEANGVTNEGTSWFSRSSDQLPGIGRLNQETDWEGWLKHEKDSTTPVEGDSQELSWEAEEAAMGAMDERPMKDDDFPEADEPQWSDGEEAGDDVQHPDLGWLDELQEAAEPTAGAELSDMDDDLPDWLREDELVGDLNAEQLEWLDEGEGSPQPPTQETEAHEGLPDWLREDLGIEEGAGVSDEGDLSWLDQIAAGEGAPMDEPPTMSWPDDEEPAAFDTLADEGAYSEVGAPQQPDDAQAWSSQEPGEDDVPEDLEEAMAWLEQLAAQQGAPVEELPSLSPAEDVDNVEAAAPSDLGEAMDWLDELTLSEGDEEFEPLAPIGSDPVAEQMGLGDSPWLDDFVGEESGEEIEEVELEIEAGIGRAEGSADQFEQDEDLLAEIGFEASDVGLDWQDQEDAATAGEAPEDLDEAMAWLEQLAAQQGAPVDELPSLQQAPDYEVEEPVAGGDFVAMPEGDAEADEAMAWLEQLAGSDDDLVGIERFDEDGEAHALDALSDIPDDPELALAWLEGLAEDSDAAMADSAEDVQPVVEDATPPVPHDVVAARAEAEAMLAHEAYLEGADVQDAEMLEDIPDDPDEAMAWLERLAARQGAPVDELPSLADEADVDVEMVEVEAGEEAPAPFDVVDEGVAGILELEPEDAPADEMPAVEGFDEEEELEALLEADIDDEELEESLPDWLALGETEDSYFDWEEATFGATGWLEAEESQPEKQLQEEAPDMEASELQEPVEDTMAAQPEESILEEVTPGPVAEQPASPEVEELELPGEAEEVIEPLADDWEAPVTAVEEAGAGADFDIEATRQALESGRIDEVIETYQSQIEQGGELSSIIAELENASAANPDHPALLHALGDAYNRNGQLQKALDAYRKALELL